MRQFHALKVAHLTEETADSRRIALVVPAELAETFEFLPGQHLPIQVEVDGQRIRRTYSICSAPGVAPLEIGVRIQPGGKFSSFAAETLRAGDTLKVMPPFGQFHATLNADHEKTCLAFAAGSGITPILSIIRATLEQEAKSRVVLFYGNRRHSTTMFIDDLYALKNRFPERLQLYFIFSREKQEFPIFDGRLDADKVRELYRTFCVGLDVDEAFVCGPDTMIESVTAALAEVGLPADSVHVERYGAPRKGPRAPAARAAATAGTASITVIMDGHRKSFDMPQDGASIVDAAAQHGIELPFSCKGGVCATCRTRVVAGEVRMDANYGLEPWEVDKGFVLACQSHPLTDHVTLDYDEA
ncbi:MAG: 2Fe-2S iron-sulfur cluster-binding protein [Woeseia sp.]